jgi:hypothetical protein
MCFLIFRNKKVHEFENSAWGTVETKCDEASYSDITNCDEASYSDITNCDEASYTDITNCDEASYSDITHLHNIVNKLDAQFFLVCLFLFSTCFGRLSAHHQEKQMHLCDTWYLL